MKRNIILSILLCLILFLCGCGAAKEAGSTPVHTSLDEFSAAGIRIGVETGSMQDALMQEQFPDAELVYFNTITDASTQVISGGIDGFSLDDVAASELCRQIPGLTVLPGRMSETNYAFAFSPDARGRALAEQASELIGRLRADGTLDEMAEEWTNGDHTGRIPDVAELSGENGTLHVATDGGFAPFSFLEGDRVVGYDMELLTRFCMEYGYTYELELLNFDALIVGVSTQYDLVFSGLSVTPEREEQVVFSAPYYVGGTVMLVRSAESEETDGGFFPSLLKSFEKTFLREERWKLILRGIGTTVYLSVCAALLGTVLGFGLALLRRMKNRAVHAVTTAYVRILQGTPLVVLLLIFFYLVFAGTGLSGEWVAIIAFALNFSAYAGEIFRAGIDSVDAGQRDAALALGYTRRQTFFRIVLPQAAMQFLPVYKGEFISLVKMTSVVGYIAIQDLTKMSDIIRSRTYEAFFPLIVTAILYFLIAALLVRLLALAEKCVLPDRAHRVPKGVRIK